MSPRRLAALALAGALVLTGCSDDPEPRFEEPTEGSSPSASESTAAAEPQTAEEFIREWFRLGTEMQNSGETGTFLEISDGCSPCRTFARQVADVYEAGGNIQIESERVVRIREMQGGDPSRPEFVVKVKSTPTTYQEAADGDVQSFPGGLNSYRIVLKKTVEGWTLVDYLDRS